MVTLRYDLTETSHIHLTILSTGEENATVSWSRNDKRLKVSKKDKRVKIGYDPKEKFYFLEIARATADDAGEYSVTATSDGGEVTSTVAVVTVEAGQRDQEPTLPELPKVVSVKEGEDIEISCTIAGLVMYSVIILYFFSWNYVDIYLQTTK